MYRIEHRSGRLLEIRISAPVSLAEAERWCAEHNAAVDAIPGNYVCLVDVVDAPVFPQEVVEAYVQVMRGEERLLRTGTLLGPSPTHGLQIQRMIKNANHPNRKAFRDPIELGRWLSEVLTVPERARLRDALAPRIEEFRGARV